jgi:hypothetical protein
VSRLDFDGAWKSLCVVFWIVVCAVLGIGVAIGAWLF